MRLPKRPPWPFALLLALAACKGEVRSPDLSLGAVAPSVVCGAQRATPVTVSGAGLTPLPVGTLTAAPQIELPAVLLQRRATADGGPAAGPEIQVPDGASTEGHVRWRSAAEMSFDVFPGLQAGLPGGPDLSPGLYDVIVANPDRRRARLEGALAVVAAPALQRAEPNPVCNAQGEVGFTLRGTGFLQIDGALPFVRFTAPGAAEPAAELLASAAADCTPLPAPAGVQLAACRTLEVQAPEGRLAPGSYLVSVRNPRDAGCATTEEVRVAVVPPPAVTEVRSATICTAQADSEIVLQGSGFLVISEGDAARGPEVLIGGQSFLVRAEDCTPVPDAPGAQLCAVLRVSVPRGALAVGSYPLTLRNPRPAPCSLEMMIQIESVPPPTLTSVQPQVLCSGGGTVELKGENFRPGATVLIDNLPTTRVTVADDGRGATADFAGPITPGGPYRITFQNADGCQSALQATMRITPGPSVLFVDPPAVPSSISVQATVYGSGVSPPVKSVEISPAGKATYSAVSFRAVPSFPNRVLITLPARLEAGSYDLRLNDQTACPAFLAGAFKVVSTPTLTVSGVVPGFGTTARDTAVVVSGDGFVSTPRVYLNPNPAGDKTAAALFAVTFQSRTSLTGVVRQGLDPGAYDLIVVNPDGSFGVRPMAFRVTPANQPPPVVTSIAPSSVVTGVSSAVAIYGSGFRSGASVSLACQDAAGRPAGGASGTVTSVMEGRIQATVVGTGVLCIVRVTNSDGTFFDYSALGVTNASLNLNGFRAGTNLTVARRGLGASAGRPTAVARFVYAVGGDGGGDAQPLRSVEAAPTGLDGTLGGWFALSQQLPAARSFLPVVNIGRFLYAVGGFDGARAAREVYRAELLSPLGAPQVTDVDVRYDEDEGLDVGLYIYRVSAVLEATDPSNPGGETLAGDFFPVHLPKVNGRLQLVLLWSRVPNAREYRIYRTVKAGDAAGSERLLATVPATAMPLQYIDDGSATPQGATPLPLGSTGAWRTIAPLNTARIGAGAAAARDPADASRWYLYAAGGSSGTLAAPAPLDTVEVLPVTVAADGSQTFGAWTALPSRLRSARWLAPAIAATADNNSLITPANTTYLYVASGSAASIGASDDRIDVAAVQGGGQLGAFGDARAPGGGIKRAGYGAVLVNNQMMAFGGTTGGGAVNNSVSASLKDATSLLNFNSFGSGVLSVPRALQGTALESAFIYQLGGATAAGLGTAQTTTEQTVW